MKPMEIKRVSSFETADALDRFRAVRRGMPYKTLWPSDIDEAIEALEEKIDRRPALENKPLTLEQLQKRDRPVWVPLDDGTGYWCLCRNGEITPPSCYPFMAKDRPKWTFLDRKPEQEEKS